MQAICQLLLLAQNLLLVLKTVSKRDILKSVLVDLLILGGIRVLPLFNLLWRQFFAIPAVDRILSHWAFQLFELVLNFLTLCLFLIEFGLELACHSIVSVLSVFQVKTDLMDIG